MIGVTADGLTVVAAMGDGRIWMTVTGVIVTTDVGLMTVAGGAGLTVMGVDGVISVGIGEKECQQAVLRPPAGL